MNIVDFEKTKDKIAVTEDAKNEKRLEMMNMYNNLVKNQEFLDILMIQMGKDIEEKFPGVEFRLISRIKTEKSFSDKLENDLIGLVDKKKIEDVKIYDTIALSIIIESVPDDIKANDPSFDSHMAELIRMRKDTHTNLKLHNAQIEEYKRRIEELKAKKQQKLSWKESNDKKIQELETLEDDIYGILDHLNKISNGLKSAVNDMDEQISHIEQDIKNMKSIISRTKDRYAREDNECNHALADFIIRNLVKFDNVKTLNLTEIPKRLKQKENYDGYRAIHNCYSTQMRVRTDDDKEENFHFICEIQGKSIDAFHVADRGKAARYHTNQAQEPGKICKRKKLPNILDVNTPEEIEKFKQEVEKNVPRFRVYTHSNYVDNEESGVRKSPEVYKLTLKECFMLYYANQLLGNEKLKIESKRDELKNLVESKKLPDDDYRLYRNYNYVDLLEK